MITKMKNNFELYYAISMIIFAVITAISKFYSLPINNAIINIVFACLPPIICIIKYKPQFRKQYLFLLIVMVVMKLLSIFVNLHNNNINYGDLFNEIYYFICFFLNYIGIFFFILPNVKKEEVDFSLFSIVFLIISIIFCIYNIVSNNISIEKILNSNNSYDFLFSYFFSNRNHLGKMLFATNIFLLYMYVYKKISKKIFILIFCFININLLLTFSRTAIFCTLILYMLFLFKNKKYWVYALICIIAVVGIYELFPTFKTFIDTFIIRRSSGLTGRGNIWLSAYRIFIKSPIVGFTNTYSSELIYILSSNYYFHNSFIKIACSDGVFCLLSWIGVFVLTFYTDINKLTPPSKNTKNKYNYVKAALFSTIIYSFFEEYILLGPGIINYWYSFILFIFIPIIYYKIASENKEGDNE